MADDFSKILVSAAPAGKGSEGAKSIFGGLAEATELDTGLIQRNLAAFLESLNTILARLPVLAQPYHLDEIELTLEVNAEGNIQLIGGVKAGATGGITLRMKR